MEEKNTPSSLKIQLLSDIHLEINVDSTFDRQPNETKKSEILKNLLDPLRLGPFSAEAPFLALLGDIGYPHSWVTKHFLLEQSKRFQKIFIVPGNHEFYSTPQHKVYVKDVFDELNKIEQETPNIIILNKSFHIHGDYRLIGVTLWEKYPYKDSNDFNKIHVDANTKYTSQHSKTWFSSEFGFIQEQLQLAKEQHQYAVIMTHHPPPMNSDLSSLLSKHKDHLPVWMYGHTHDSSEQRRNNTLIISNQLGYLQLGDKDDDFYTECVVAMQGPKAQVVCRRNLEKERMEEERIKRAKEEEANKKPAPLPPPPPPPGGRGGVTKKI